MNCYERLLCNTDNIIVVEKPFKSKAKGLCKGNKIGINKNISTTVEKTCILAEELGHYYTTAGNILDQTDTMNRKQEYRARLWAYNDRIGLHGLIAAYEHGCQNLAEAAEYLDVTEEFLLDALACYRNKYGICTSVREYTIYFEPVLAISKSLMENDCKKQI